MHRSPTMAASSAKQRIRLTGLDPVKLDSDYAARGGVADRRAGAGSGGAAYGTGWRDSM
jgi:hypothetical protein